MARPRKLPSGMTLRGKTYYAGFRANGRLIRKKLATDFRVACDLLAELKARAARADFGLTDNDYLWDDLKAEFLRWAKQSNRNPGDYEADLNKLEEYRRVRSVRQIDHEWVYGFRHWRLEQVCPRTVNKQVGTLINMLNKGVAWGRIGENLIADIKPLRHDELKKERRALSVAEVEALFEASPDYLLPVWRMFMVTGIRKTELVEMTFDDVDFERQTATVRRGTAKNHKEREIPLDEEMLAIIRRLRDEAPNRQPVPGRTHKGKLSRRHVFVNGGNAPLRNNLLRSFYARCARAGIEGAEKHGSVDLHSLRVTFTTLALEGGAAPKAIQAILGHSTLSLTMGIYAKATDNAKRSAISALPFASTSAPDHVIPMQVVPKVCASPEESPQSISLQRVRFAT